MLKYRRQIKYQNKPKIQNILQKFDMDVAVPQTGLSARGVSSLSQTSTISVRLGGKMVSQETMVQPVFNTYQDTTTETVIHAQVTRTIEVLHAGGTVFILAGNIIEVDVVENIGLFNGFHFNIMPDQYRALGQ